MIRPSTSAPACSLLLPRRIAPSLRWGPSHRSRSCPAFGFSPSGGLPVVRGCVLACGLVASRCRPWGSPRFRPPVPGALSTTSRWFRPAGSRSSSSRRWTLRSLPLTRSRVRVTAASLPSRRSPSSALPSCRYRALQRLALPTLRLSPGFGPGPLLAFAGHRHRRMRPCPRPAARRCAVLGSPRLVRPTGFPAALRAARHPPRCRNSSASVG